MRFALIFLFICLFAPPSLGQYIIEDEGVGITAEEMAFIVDYWTPQMRHAAAVDLGDRFELLNMALANKKIALEAEKFTPEQNAERYWNNRLIIRNAQRRFVVNDYMIRLEVPDMTELARERYITNKDKYALVPEQRMSSHILFRCTPPDCDRDVKKGEVAKVLAELRAGADFEALAAKYSEDPGSKDKGGKFDRWLQKGSQDVDPHYLQAALEIESIGDYSEMVDSNFGVHIIRLDEIKPQQYKPFEEVEALIIADLETEYRKLAAKEFDARFRLTEKAFIDAKAMDAIFAPYVAEEPPAQ